MEIWAVEGITHSILHFLDLASLDAVLAFLQRSTELQDYLKDALLWSDLTKVHIGGHRDAETTSSANTSQDRAWDWTSRERTCTELQAFLQSMDDLTRFEQAVTILDGDIQHIDNIDGKPLDGIAFPTNSSLMNPHIAKATGSLNPSGRAGFCFVNAFSTDWS
ncbi:Macro domain-containing protein [Phytophthora cinnamomi]|uniref:Macro domain-containing protein n=1 Tax=Phytophthora cinnamomi TaxID=4785 RepID=UPI003559C90A|nr:Macro domain-containing protein [Phytophthora cinnamomi]